MAFARSKADVRRVCVPRLCAEVDTLSTDTQCGRGHVRHAVPPVMSALPLRLR
jgi:hypothetical protein